MSKENLTVEEFKSMFNVQKGKELSNLNFESKFVDSLEELGEEEFIGPSEIEGKSVLYFWRKESGQVIYSDDKINKLLDTFCSELNEQEYYDFLEAPNKLERYKDNKYISEASKLIEEYDLIADTTWGWWM